MKIFLTIELIAFLVFVIGQWQYWSHTSNWRTNDAGWSYTYTTSIWWNNNLRNTNFISVIIAVIGILYLIWA